LKNGKADGLDDLSCEHLKYSHPIIVSMLCKLVNIFLANGHVPDSFGKSYTGPIQKSYAINRALTVDDFLEHYIDNGSTISRPYVFFIFKQSI